MKKINISFLLTLLIAFIVIASDGAFCQPPSPPDGHGLSGNQGAGGSAALDGGSMFLLLSGSSYGVYKLMRAWKKVKNGK
jgi:hypothetical protein